MNSTSCPGFSWIPKVLSLPLGPQISPGETSMKCLEKQHMSHQPQYSLSLLENFPLRFLLQVFFAIPFLLLLSPHSCFSLSPCQTTPQKSLADPSYPWGQSQTAPKHLGTVGMLQLLQMSGKIQPGCNGKELDKECPDKILYFFWKRKKKKKRRVEVT